MRSVDYIVALFGEACKGEFQRAHFCQTLIDLSDKLGEPPTQDSQGLSFAIQALLYNRDVLYFRVHEEGFSVQDYLTGLNYLEDRKLIPRVSAICLPGVGDNQIIEASSSLCELHKSFLILTEKDL